MRVPECVCVCVCVYTCVCVKCVLLHEGVLLSHHQQLRKLVLDLIHRLPTNDHLKGHVKVQYVVYGFSVEHVSVHALFHLGAAFN